MKREVFCGGGACLMTAIVYDDSDPEALAPHVVCPECREAAEADGRRLGLIGRIADGTIEDRDLEQVIRLVDHLFGVQVDPALKAAGSYSLTKARRKKLRRQMDDEFGPRIPDVI